MSCDQKIKHLLKPYENCIFYAVDPGAFAILAPIYEQAKADATNAQWLLEGWAAQNHTSVLPTITKLPTAKPKSSFIMGQQTDCERSFTMLKRAKNQGYKALFVSDHWKNVTPSFFDESGVLCLPDQLLVPDQVAYDTQYQALQNRDVAKTQIKKAMSVFCHPGLDAILKNAQNTCDANLNKLLKKYECGAHNIFMPLDPFEEETKLKYGYDWQSALLQANQTLENYTDTTLLVKAHPRQRPLCVEKFIQEYCSVSVKYVAEPMPEPFLAMAEEVWGISSLLLIVALKMGKPIKSFMPGATQAGLAHSNAHIAPFIVNEA